MKKRKLALLLLPLLFLASCGQNYSGDVYKDSIGGEVSEESGSNIVVETNAKIIYTVSYIVISENIQTVSNDIKNKVNELGGHIDSSDESETYARVVYKVPTDKLDTFIDYVDAKEGVSDKSVSTSDVSSTYSAVEAKLKVLNDSKAYYNQYLTDNEDTLTLEEKIIILNKISDIDEELYEYSYTKAKLDDKLDYSTVTIVYRVESSYEDTTWWQDYGQYLANFGIGLVDFVMYLLPVAVLGGGIFCAIYFPITCSKKKKKAKNNENK